jgi:flagellar basal-body rod protein FlgG
MLRALYTSATGMHAQELLIDNTANNIANVNTTGFKRSQLDFADLVYATLREPGTQNSSGQQIPTGLQIGSGVRAVGTTRLHTTGTLQQTSNTFDMAIEGDGFFTVQDVEGNLFYTRAGNFRLDGQNQLVTPDGYLLDPSITIQPEAQNVTVSEDGSISGTLPGQTQSQVLGQIQLSRFPNPSGLKSEGNNLYSATDAAGTIQQGQPGLQGMGSLRQGFLEGSNVQVVTELISLISAQRAYEINSRAIRAGDEMLSTTTDIVR